MNQSTAEIKDNKQTNAMEILYKLPININRKDEPLEYNSPFKVGLNFSRIPALKPVLHLLITLKLLTDKSFIVQCEQEYIWSLSAVFVIEFRFKCSCALVIK